jgi:hypothetical protein
MPMSLAVLAVEAEVFQRLQHVEVALAGGDDAEPRARRVDDDAVDAVGAANAIAACIAYWCSRISWSIGGSGQRMLSPPGGSSKSVGRTMSSWCGSTLTEAEDSTVSAMVLKPTQRPVKRLIAQPRRPMSRMSCTPAGFSTGIIADELVLAGVRQRRRAAGVVVAGQHQHAAVLRLVPAALPCLNTSPQRSTPGPLPYHMANTPSYGSRPGTG